MNWPDMITLGIAIYGAALSTFVFIRGKRRIRVECGFQETPRPGQPRLWCKVINTGYVPVTISAVTMSLIVEGQLKVTAIYGDSSIEAGMCRDLAPGAAVCTAAPARYEKFFLRLVRIDARTHCGRLARVNPRALRRTQMELRASIQKTGLLDLAKP